MSHSGRASSWSRSGCTFGSESSRPRPSRGSSQKTASKRRQRSKSSSVSQRRIILTALARMGQQAPFYIFASFVFTYGVTFLHSSRDLLLTALLTASALSFFTMPFSGHLSDRFGRKRIYLIGAVGIGVFGFVYFALLNTMVPGWMFLAIVVSFIPHDMMYGPQAALIAECFTPRLRYSGASYGSAEISRFV